MLLIDIPDTLQAMLDMREASESLRSLVRRADDDRWERADNASLLSMAAYVHAFVDELSRLDTKYSSPRDQAPPSCDCCDCAEDDTVITSKEEIIACNKAMQELAELKAKFPPIYLYAAS